MIHNVESNVLSPLESKTNTETKSVEVQTSKSIVEFSRSNKFSSNISSSSNFHQNLTNFNNLSSTNSPILPETKNLIEASTQNIKTPPPPPPRWAKPGISQSQTNFTVTTTVSFNVNQNNDCLSQVIWKMLLKSSMIIQRLFLELFLNFVLFTELTYIFEFKNRLQLQQIVFLPSISLTFFSFFFSKIHLRIRILHCSLLKVRHQPNLCLQTSHQSRHYPQQLQCSLQRRN